MQELSALLVTLNEARRLSGAVFELTTPRRDGVDVQLGRAEPSGATVMGQHECILRIRRDLSRVECQIVSHTHLAYALLAL